MVCSEGHQPKSGFRNRYDFVRVHVCPDMSASPLRAQKDLYLHGLEMRLPKLFETWNNMKRLIDRIVIRQFPDLEEDLILVTNRTHFSDALKNQLNDVHVKPVFDNMPGKIHFLA